ncbi:hypothetical protein QBC43DRAFT_311930 [Cladorrhinum sp. PSN259]|nr:hypothetical protein QBC43DRAFT_311930 [Cladorrhinum sp. PSN259]
MAITAGRGIPRNSDPPSSAAKDAGHCIILSSSQVHIALDGCTEKVWQHSGCCSYLPLKALVYYKLPVRTRPALVLHHRGENQENQSTDESEDDADIDAEHPFGEHVETLVAEAHAKFSSQARDSPPPSAKRCSPEQDCPSKRRKLCEYDDLGMKSEEVEEHADQGWNTTPNSRYSSPRRHSSARRTQGPTFDCPYHKYSPKKYRHLCLINRFPTIRSVLSHIQRAHGRAPYCPTCHSEFRGPNGDAKRRKHIRGRKCKRREGPIMIEGLQGDRMDRLCELEPSGTEKQQWKQIWKIVYPDVAPPSSPHLDDGTDKYVKLVLAARKFWEQNGRSLVMGYLQKTEQGEEMSSDSENWMADAESLQRAVLKRLLERLLREDHGQQ